MNKVDVYEADNRRIYLVDTLWELIETNRNNKIRQWYSEEIGSIKVVDLTEEDREVLLTTARTLMELNGYPWEFKVLKNKIELYL